jgi:hypothetical protein
MQMNTFLIDGLKRLAASVQIASACFMHKDGIAKQVYLG